MIERQLIKVVHFDSDGSDIILERYEDVATATDEEKKLEELLMVKEVKLTELQEQFTQDVQNISIALPHEMASWQKQEEQARLWNNDNTVVTPIIDTLVIARGFEETKQELVDKILANASAYEVLYGTLLGKYHNKIKQLDLATLPADILAITW